MSWIHFFDLWADVPPEKFIEEARNIQPDIIDLLRSESAKWPKKLHIIIGGSQIDEHVSQLIGSDNWVNEADAGVMLCKKLLAENCWIDL